MQATVKRWFGKAPDLGAVVARFPTPVIAMGVFTVLMVIFKDTFNTDFGENIGRLMIGLVIAGYFCVSTVLISEAHNKGRRLPLQIGIVIVIGALAWFSKGLRLNLPMAVGASVLLLGNAVIWRKSRDDLHVWDFTHKLWTGAIFAVVGSIIFALGMIAIQEALKSLFGLNIRNLVGDFLLPIGLCFLAPLYWMATLPPVDEDYSELYDNPSFVSKAVTFLGTWLLSPLTLIYALILVAYGVKIVISGELPNGEIAGLISPFLIVGTLTWLVLDPPFANDKALAKLFRRLWWPVSIPASLLLAVAIFVRVREYGYTPERIALAALIVWALGLALWFTFAPKAKRDIRFIPGFAAVLLALGTFSAGWLSYVNQGHRFESNLIASGVIGADGKIANAPVLTDQDAAKRAKGAFEYLMRNAGKMRVADVLEGTGVTFNLEKSSNSEILTALGLDKIKLYNRYGDSSRTYFDRESKPLSIASYDTLLGPYDIYNKNSAERVLFSESEISAKVENNFIYFDFKGEVIPFNFAKWIDDQNLGYGEVKIETPLIILKDDEADSLALVVNRFSRQARENDDADSFTVAFYVLTRGLE